jgi:hypothetical protein
MFSLLSHSSTLYTSSNIIPRRPLATLTVLHVLNPSMLNFPFLPSSLNTASLPTLQHSLIFSSISPSNPQCLFSFISSLSVLSFLLLSPFISSLITSVSLVFLATQPSISSLIMHHFLFQRFRIHSAFPFFTSVSLVSLVNQSSLSSLITSFSFVSLVTQRSLSSLITSFSFISQVIQGSLSSLITSFSFVS